MVKRFKVLNTYIDSLTTSDFLSDLVHVFRSNEKVFVVTMNAEGLLLAEKDKDFKKSSESANYVTADGVGPIWSAGFLRKYTPKSLLRYIWIPIHALFSLLWLPIWFTASPKKIFPERLSGSDLFWDINSLAEKEEKSVYLLGAKKGVAKRVSEKLKKIFPKIKIAGFYHGDPYEKGLVEKINEADSDILFVAWNQPKQEKWIADNINDLNINLAIGIGGTFDFVSGKKLRAPRFMRTLGLEWLFRLIIEPQRMGRVFTAVPKFIYATVKYKINNPREKYE